MSRPPEPEKKLAIETTARQLFLEVGYQKTTYQQIADALGTQKSNIQKHLPKKSLFISDFFEDLLNAANGWLEERGPADDGYFEHLFRIGTLQFALMLSGPELQRFTQDILSSREVTEVIIQEDISWAGRYSSVFALDLSPRIQDSVTFVMGGVYEQVYQRLLRKDPPNPQQLMEHAVRMFAYSMDMALEAPEWMEPEVVSKAVRYLKETLFS